MQILAVCGVKNSGKTTLLEKITAHLSKEGIKIAVIKHDGHSFVPDRPGTDSFRLKAAGAYGAAVFSSQCFSIVKDTVPPVTEADLISFFPEADLILLEGFKNSPYPKIEIVRRGVSRTPVSNPDGLLAVATDLPPEAFSWVLPAGVLLTDLNDADGICRLIRETLLRIQQPAVTPISG